MMINVFNSLGSNYNFKFVLESLFSRSNSSVNLRLKSFLENKYGGEAVLLYKGREAIELALRLLNLPKGAVVAFNGFTCYAVYKAIVQAGYGTAYLDIEDLNLNFSPAKLIAELEKNSSIKALIIQNTLGYPCEIEEISRICKEENIILIEDLAHSVGAVYKNGLEAGIAGDFTVLSFSQDKMIDAVSGGALIVRNKAYRKTNSIDLKKISSRQIIDKFYPLFTFIIRSSYRFYLGNLIHFALKKANLLSKPIAIENDEELHSLSSWYCSLITKQFEQLVENLKHRRDIASIYVRQIDTKVQSDSVMRNILNSSNLRYPIFIGSDRVGLVDFLETEGVYVSDIWYDAPVAPRKFIHLTDYKNQCPNAEKISSEILNLPTHINISEKKAMEISKLINLWLKSK